MTSKRTIVVGYDGSPASRAAVQHGVRAAGPEGRVVIVNAYQIPPDYMGEPFYQDMLSAAVKRSEDATRDLEATCEGLAGLDHEMELMAGDAGEGILKVAESRKADEIIVGSRGLGRVGSWLMGSVAQKVIRGAQCPVLVIPDRVADAHEASASGAAASVA
jgi:nucleotide-binding universal stress UspA family protein